MTTVSWSIKVLFGLYAGFVIGSGWVRLNGAWRSVIYGIRVSNFLPPIRNSDKGVKILG